MFDRRLIPIQKRLLEPIAKRLAASGVGADAITIAGFIVGLAALPFLAFQAYSAALFCILANRVLDGLDGTVARLTRPSDRGAYLDIAFDMFFWSTIPLGFAWANPAENALAACALLLSFVGTGSSFLAFAAITHKRGDEKASYPGKGIQYIGGLAEGAETIAVFVLMCVFPSTFNELAWAFAAICLVTTVVRWWEGWRVFGAVVIGLVLAQI
ncbi:MAG: CDP-alcohol phosphatidyltransferase family protein, partial [Mesorhizobium sp.]